MIPKIIHYCWFGGNELPEEYISYIQGWRDLHPDWEMVRWDESNSPMDLQYMQNAQKNKKWANMSNLVRFHALLKHGGIYLDTDMKLLKSFEPLLNNKCFLGFEEGEDKESDFWVNNAVIGSLKKHSFIQNCIDCLLKEFDGVEAANLSAPRLVTKLLKEKYGLHEYGFQILKDVTLYPVSFFYPVKHQYAYKISTINVKDFMESYAIHSWGRSWYTREIAIQEIDELRKWSDDLYVNISELKKDIIFERKKNEDISQRYEAQIAKLNSQVLTFEAEEAEKKQRIGTLEKQLENLVNEETKLSEQIANLSVQNDLLQDQHQKMYEKIKESNSLINELRSQNRELTENIHELTDQIDAYHTREKGLSEKIEKQDLEFKQFKINENILIAERSDLNKKLFEMMNALDECVLVKEELFLKNNKLNDQFKEFTIEKEVNEKKINLQKEKNEALQTQLSAMKNSYSLLENEQKIIVSNHTEIVTNLQKQLSMNGILIGDLNKGIINLLESIKEKNENLLSYSSQIEIKDNELNAKKMENVNLENRITDLIDANDWYKRTYERRKLIGIIKDRIVSLFK